MNQIDTAIKTLEKCIKLKENIAILTREAVQSVMYTFWSDIAVEVNTMYTASDFKNYKVIYKSEDDHITVCVDEVNRFVRFVTDYPELYLPKYCSRLFAHLDCRNLDLTGCKMHPACKSAEYMFCTMFAETLTLTGLDMTRVEVTDGMFAFSRIKNLEVDKGCFMCVVSARDMFKSARIRNLNMGAMEMKRLMDATRMFKDFWADVLYLEGACLKYIRQADYMFGEARVWDVYVSEDDTAFLTDSLIACGAKFAKVHTA